MREGICSVGRCVRGSRLLEMASRRESTVDSGRRVGACVVTWLTVRPCSHADSSKQFVLVAHEMCSQIALISVGETTPWRVWSSVFCRVPVVIHLEELIFLVDRRVDLPCGSGLWPGLRWRRLKLRRLRRRRNVVNMMWCHWTGCNNAVLPLMLRLCCCVRHVGLWSFDVKSLCRILARVLLSRFLHVWMLRVRRTGELGS